MHHTFMSCRYEIIFCDSIVDEDVDCDGLCDAPGSPRKAIRIKNGLRGQDRLDTLIHEAIHACLFCLSESTVADAATWCAMELWRDNVRPDAHRDQGRLSSAICEELGFALTCIREDYIEHAAEDIARFLTRLDYGYGN